MHLHEELGPRATSISAIAERAGVQRLTVYRHFPDETAVFQACTSHWLSLNPPPDPSSWKSIEDPLLRLRTAVAAFYSYFSRTRRMWSVSHRDVADVPALRGPMAEFLGFLDMVATDLTEQFQNVGGRRPLLAATIGHLLSFPTWEDLEGRHLDDQAKIAVAEHWVRGVLRDGPQEDPA